jgi:hypothetical protein
VLPSYYRQFGGSTAYQEGATFSPTTTIIITIIIIIVIH